MLYWASGIISMYLSVKMLSMHAACFHMTPKTHDTPLASKQKACANCQKTLLSQTGNAEALVHFY